MDDSLNNFLQAENMLFNNDNNDIPNELNTLFNENNIEPFAIFGFNNNNNNLLNDNMEGPTGYTLHIHPQEPIANEHEFQNRERRRERGRGRGQLNVEGHTKYAFDNMVRKTKSMIIKLLLNFINKKIFVIYDGKIGHGDNIKKLFLMNQAQVSNANIHFNRAFLERTLGEINEGDYDLLVGFVHKDAAASFFVTFDQILNTKSLALVFSRDMDEVEEFVNMIEESGSNAKIQAVRAFHNPSPIKVKFDKAIKEFE